MQIDRHHHHVYFSTWFLSARLWSGFISSASCRNRCESYNSGRVGLMSATEIRDTWGTPLARYRGAELSPHFIMKQIVGKVPLVYAAGRSKCPRYLIAGVVCFLWSFGKQSAYIGLLTWCLALRFAVFKSLWLLGRQPAASSAPAKAMQPLLATKGFPRNESNSR